MKTLTLSLLLLTSACANVPNPYPFPGKDKGEASMGGLLNTDPVPDGNGGINRKAIKCRITFYTGAKDKWGNLVACQKTKRATAGITVAMEKKHAFGTKIRIPVLKGKLDADDKFICQDRGSAVQSRKASMHKEIPVVDVFCSSHAQYLRLVKSTPAYAIVIFER